MRRSDDFIKIVLFGFSLFSFLFAQDVSVEGTATSNNQVFKASYTGTSTSAICAVTGQNTLPGGIGVMGLGGSMGVYGYVNTGNPVRYGVRGQAISGATLNIGVYGWGSGGTTAWGGYFYGNIYTTGTLTEGSDERLKKNIDSLGPVLTKLMKINAIRYEFDTTVINGLPSGKQIGFTAQNVEEYFPECVKDVVMPITNKNGDFVNDASGNAVTKTYKAITYNRMIPILLNAIKEQQKQIEDLRAQINK